MSHLLIVRSFSLPEQVRGVAWRHVEHHDGCHSEREKKRIIQSFEGNMAPTEVSYMDEISDHELLICHRMETKKVDKADHREAAITTFFSISRKMNRTLWQVDSRNYRCIWRIGNYRSRIVGFVIDRLRLRSVLRLAIGKRSLLNGWHPSVSSSLLIRGKNSHQEK